MKYLIVIILLFSTFIFSQTDTESEASEQSKATYVNPNIKQYFCDESRNLTVEFYENSFYEHGYTNYEDVPVKIANVFSLNVGFSTVNLNQFNIGTATNITKNFSIMILALYVEYQTNGVSGNGKYLKFRSSQTTVRPDLSYQASSLGVNLKILNTFIVTPYISKITTSKIYQDPILFDSYFTEVDKTHYSLGILLSYYYKNKVGLSIGTGIFENIKVTINYNLFDFQ